MANHRYWRIFAYKNAGDGSFIQFAEVEMRLTSGGADQCTGGTAACTGSLQAGSAAGVFANDNSTTFAQWNGTTNKWVSYDFGAGNEKDIVEVRICGATGAASRSPQHFVVQYSDDNSTWTTAWSVSNTTSWVTNTFKTFTKPTVSGTNVYRYWRLRLGDDGIIDASVWAVSALEMRLTEGGANQCSGGIGVRLADNGANVIANAYDGNSATFWAGTVTGGHEYLGYDFGVGVTKGITSFYMVPRQDTANYNQWPRSIWIEAGDDGLNWLPQWANTKTLAGNPSGTGYEFMNPASVAGQVTYRYWGIRVTAIQSGTTFGIREIEFRATIGGSDLTTGGVGLAYTSFGSTTRPDYAYDSTTNEHGSDSSLGINHITAYDYGSASKKAIPAQIAITARTSGGFNNHNQCCTAFDLVYSVDGFTWITQESFVAAAWTSASQQLFNVTTASSRRRSSGQMLLAA